MAYLQAAHMQAARSSAWALRVDFEDCVETLSQALQCAMEPEEELRGFVHRAHALVVVNPQPDPKAFCGRPVLEDARMRLGLELACRKASETKGWNRDSILQMTIRPGFSSVCMMDNTTFEWMLLQIFLHMPAASITAASRVE